MVIEVVIFYCVIKDGGFGVVLFFSFFWLVLMFFLFSKEMMLLEMVL